MQLYYRLRDVPPVLIWLALCGMALLLGEAHAPTWWGLVLIVPSVVLRVWARRYIGAHSRGRVLAAPALCTDGPYSLSRNPLYVSNTLLGLGLVVCANMLRTDIAWPLAGGAALLSLLFCVHYGVLAKIEAAFVRSQWPQQYDAWAAHTPLILALRSVTAGSYTKGVPLQSSTRAFMYDRSTWLSQTVVVAAIFLL